MTTYIIVIACVIAWIFLLIPSISYLRTAWKTRFEMLKAILDENALKIYFEQFYPSKKNIQNNNLIKEFELLFNQHHGRKKYLIPIILLCVISGIGILFVANNLLFWLKIDPFFAPLPPITISAFLGAYMWVAYDQFYRFRTRDFNYHDVYNCSFRFIIAVPLGLSFAAIFKDSVVITSAFLLGSFPTQTLFKFGRRFMTQKLYIKNQEDEVSNELEKLQCINREEAERYREEGTTNICQLAYSDPVDLTIRTNFDFNYVVDCISQALLWLYVGKNLDKLHPLGIRGAQEAYQLNNCLNSQNNDEKAMAEGNFREIAKVLNITENTLKMTLFEVTEDPYTQFLCNVWR
jgi:hypothetical protein